jgi:putative transposase
MRAVKNVRLKDYDYSSDGFYFITICTNYRRPYLAGATKDMVSRSIERLPDTVTGVRVDYHRIMPSHVHLILVLDECQFKLSEIVRRLKAATTKEARFRLWQPNYYEHVIRTENALAKIRQYIQDNPLVERLEL